MARKPSKRTLIKRYAQSARQAGRLAERAVLDMWGLTEQNNVEIKGCAAHKYRFALPLQQLLNCQSKAYIIVVYDRKVERTVRTANLYHYKLTIAEAFQEPLTFVLTDAAALIKVLLRNQFRLLGTPNEHGWVNVKVWFPWSRITATQEPWEKEGHRVFGSESVLPEPAGNLCLPPSYENVPWALD